MFGATGKTAWRLLAAVPFVLLLGIVGIKVTAGDPSSPFNKIPGAQTIQELGDDAPSTNVTVKLPKTKKPSPTTSESASASASASASDSATTSPTAKATTARPTRKATSGSSGGSGGGSTPTPDHTPTPDPPPTETRSPQQIRCAETGGAWRQNPLTGEWNCWPL